MGLLGANGIIEAKSVPKHVPIIVLEASKALPGAEIGKGPVVRVGDQLSLFDPSVEYAIHEVARKLQKTDSTFTFQRQLMSGGTCEASVYVLNGYRVGALAYPLGNYHNQGKRRPAPEIISLSDAENMIRLCHEISIHPPADDTRGPLRDHFDGRYHPQRQRLLDTR